MVKSETKPSTPPEELLDEEVFMGLCNYDQSTPGELEEEVAKYHKEAFSPPSLLTRDAERQKPGGEIQGAKRLERCNSTTFTEVGNSASLLILP